MKETRTYTDRREYNITYVKKRRKQLKIMAVEYLGGKCMRCGYDKFPQVLEFHHRNPAQKEFGLGMRGLTRSWEKIKQEIIKCDLLCANCHREIHIEKQDFGIVRESELFKYNLVNA